MKDNPIRDGISRDPRFGEINYDASINTPSKSLAYFSAFHEPLIEAAKKLTTDQVTILGIACGPGYEFEFMRDDPRLRIVGFDLDPELIKQAEKRFEGSAADVSFFVGDTRKPLLIEETADLAIAVNALIYNPDDLLDTAKKHMKINGKLVLNARIYGNPFNNPFFENQTARGATLEEEVIYVNGEKFTLKAVNYSSHVSLPQLGRQVYFTSEEDLEKFMRLKGFEISEHEKYHYASTDNPDNEVEVYTLQNIST